MTPDSHVLPAALTLVALLLAALGAVLLFRGAREESHAPALDLTDAAVRVGDGVLRFRVEGRPSGGAAFRAELSRQVN